MCGGNSQPNALSHGLCTLTGEGMITHAPIYSGDSSYQTTMAGKKRKPRDDPCEISIWDGFKKPRSNDSETKTKRASYALEVMDVRSNHQKLPQSGNPLHVLQVFGGRVTSYLNTQDIMNLMHAVPSMKDAFALWFNVTKSMVPDPVGFAEACLENESDRFIIREWLQSGETHSLLQSVTAGCTARYIRSIYDMRRDKCMRARGNWIRGRNDSLDEPIFPMIFDWIARIHAGKMGDFHTRSDRSSKSPFGTVHLAMRYFYAFACFRKQQMTTLETRLSACACYIVAMEESHGKTLARAMGITTRHMSRIISTNASTKSMAKCVRDVRSAILSRHALFLRNARLEEPLEPRNSKLQVWNHVSYPPMRIRTVIDIIPGVIEFVYKQHYVEDPHVRWCVRHESNYRADLCAGDVRSSVASPTRTAVAVVLSTLADLCVQVDTGAVIRAMGISERLFRLDKMYIRVIVRNANRAEARTPPYDVRCICPSSFVIKYYRKRRMRRLFMEQNEKQKQKTFGKIALKIQSDNMSLDIAHTSLHEIPTTSHPCQL